MQNPKSQNSSLKNIYFKINHRIAKLLRTKQLLQRKGTATKL